MLVEQADRQTPCQIKLFDVSSDADWEILQEWYRKRNLPGIPKGILPALSIWITCNGEPSAFGAIYMDNSVNVAHLMWVSTNPAMPATLTLGAINQLIISASELCKLHGYRVMFTTVGKRSMAKLMRRHGFTELHDQTHSLIKPLID